MARHGAPWSWLHSTNQAIANAAAASRCRARCRDGGFAGRHWDHRQERITLRFGIGAQLRRVRHSSQATDRNDFDESERRSVRPNRRDRARFVPRCQRLDLGIDGRLHRTRERHVNGLRDVLELLQHGVQLDQMASPGSAIGAAAALGFLFGAIPVGAAEMLAIGAGAVRPRTLIIPLVVALSAGHVAGKMVWYWIGTLEARVTQPRLRSWVEQPQVLRRQYPQLGTGLLATSALASVPPFHLMVVAAGIGRIPLPTVVLTSFAMRLLRFGLIAAFPTVLRALF